ncbi:hypothetical protein TCAL_05377 [Tigriopus californicus]|uniref:Nuclear receptor domain-containing protein n=1 Tax=Tigriopus californicus TaxID=6832 RepID=A0A553NQK2_TIGCA|nr:nuclear hormone receptor family member nhr-7-like [Tigriopus californicus]TRY67697.1 hypothetical protein TCAL_05377 [Tigriopus californicus]|eukprot:TCALIF_05377-PA protein Name:"Similar to nhr-7 Nuclear hormone receptor family member nhr-7 (Caenorhabditis elegans)" AED:0.05 eAED:0.12 QI:0/-1/0/1/-1/1/1/0/368
MSSGSEPAKRSRTCSVCQGPTESYHLNYGVSSCFSCRAFFRRSVQDDKYESFKCKRKSHCDVTKTGGQKCKKCRFDQCIAAGMKPECVMNKDQKKKRFRKCLERQMQLNSPPEPSLSRPADDLCASLSEIRYNKINRSSSRGNKPVVKDIVPSSNLKGSQSMVATGSSLPRVPEAETAPDISTSSCTKFKSKLMRMYEEEVAAHDENQDTLVSPTVLGAFDRNECINLWNQSMSEIRFHETWADELKRFHSPIADINGTAMRRHAYQAFIRDICRVFHGFARRLPMFRQLSKKDQQVLLWRNPVNFAAFILGRYYGAATNQEQLRRVFISDDGILPAEPLNFIGFCQRLDVKYSSPAIIQTNELSKQI